MPHAVTMQLTALVSFFLSALSALGQGTILIGPSAQNGSFEDGVASPWRDIQVANDPLFASDGVWFGVAQGTAPGQTARAGPNQLFPPESDVWVQPGNGLTFLLSFHARNATAGFDAVSSSINAWNADGTFVLPSVTPITSPPLSSTAWTQHEMVFQFPDTWDGGGPFIVGIQFTKHGAALGTTYTGYLDNIVLQQIPEPSSLVLYLCGGALWLVVWVWRRTGCAVKRPVLKAG